MRKIVLALASIAAIGIVLPVTLPADAGTKKVLIKHSDRGLHKGWTRGHHYGWDRGRTKEVVVIKRGRHD
jgi:hypothetical protein